MVMMNMCLTVKECFIIGIIIGFVAFLSACGKFYKNNFDENSENYELIDLIENVSTENFLQDQQKIYFDDTDNLDTDKLSELQSFLNESLVNQQIFKAHMMMGMNISVYPKFKFLNPSYVAGDSQTGKVSETSEKSGYLLAYAVSADQSSKDEFVIKPKILDESDTPDIAKKIIKCVEADNLSTDIIRISSSESKKNSEYRPDGKDAEIEYKQINTRSELKKILNKSLDISASIDVPTHGNVTLENENDLVENSVFVESSEYYAQSITVNNPAVRMINPRLTEQAKAYLDKNDPQKLYEVCGDKFIYGYVTGGKLLSILKVSLKNQYKEKEKSVSASLNASGFVFGAKVKIDLEKNSKELANTQKLNINIYTRFIGGKILPISNDLHQWNHMFKDWSESVTNNAVVTHYIVRPIKDLVNLYEFDVDYDRRSKALKKLNNKLDALYNYALIFDHETQYKGFNLSQITSTSKKELKYLIKKIQGLIDKCKPAKKNSLDNCVMSDDLNKRFLEFDFSIKAAHELCGFETKKVYERHESCKEKETITVEKDNTKCNIVYNSGKIVDNTKEIKVKGFLSIFYKNPDIFRQDYSKKKFFKNECKDDENRDYVIRETSRRERTKAYDFQKDYNKLEKRCADLQRERELMGVCPFNYDLSLGTCRFPFRPFDLDRLHHGIHGIGGAVMNVKKDPWFLAFNLANKNNFSDAENKLKKVDFINHSKKRFDLASILYDFYDEKGCDFIEEHNKYKKFRDDFYHISFYEKVEFFCNRQDQRFGLKSYSKCKESQYVYKKCERTVKTDKPKTCVLNISSLEKYYQKNSK